MQAIVEFKGKKNDIKMYTYISVLVIGGASRGAEVETLKWGESNS